MICTPFYLTASAFVGAAPASKIASSRMARVPAVVAIGRGTTFWSAHEAEAKSAWLTRLDFPAWGPAAEVVSSVLADAERFAECDLGVEAACEQLSKEDEAKRLWLSRIDDVGPATWGKVARCLSAGQKVAAAKDEDAAKKAWLASLEQEPSWLR